MSIYDSKFNNIFNTQPLLDTPPGAKNNFMEGVDPTKIGGGDPEFRVAKFGNKLISVNPGESIQKAINSMNDVGGGIVYLQNGTHYINSDLVLYSHVYLKGSSVSGTILDFNGGAYSLLIQGSDAYETGTVSVNAGATTVTGNLTVWTQSMVGQSILLDGDWYGIASVTSETELELDFNFLGNSISGASYVIVSTIDDVNLSYFTIQNSSVNLIEIQYANLAVFRFVDAYSAEKVFNVLDTLYFEISESNVGEATTGFYLDNCYSYTFDTFFIFNCTGNGLEFIGGGDSTLINFGISSCNIGLNMTDVSKLSCFSFTIDNNTSHGVEYVSGCNDNQMIGGAVSDNGRNGITFTDTSDTNIIQSVQIKNNSSFGIDIANSNCNNNIVLGNIFIDNTTANERDLGLSNMFRSNIGVDDNIAPSKSPSSSPSISPSAS